MTAPTIPEGYVLMPAEPDHAVIKAMAESRAVDDEGEFPAMLDLLDFSGQNKTHTVLRAAYAAAITAVPAIPLPAAPVQFNKSNVNTGPVVHGSMVSAILMRWQPIETAPKERIFGYGENNYGPYLLLTDGHEVVRGRWWFHNDGAENFIRDGGIAFHASHYMHLPPPPVGENE